MADGEYLHGLIFDQAEYMVGAATFTKEEPAHALSPEGRLGRERAAVRKFSQALDGLAQSVEPFQRRAFGRRVEIALNALSIQDAIRQNVSSSVVHEPLPPAALCRFLPRLR